MVPIIMLIYLWGYLFVYVGMVVLVCLKVSLVFFEFKKSPKKAKENTKLINLTLQ